MTDLHTVGSGQDVETPARDGRGAERVADVMTTNVVTVGPDAGFREIVDLLLTDDISGVPVVDSDGRLLGIITESDLITKEAKEPDRPRPRRHLSMLRDHLLGRGHDWVDKAGATTAAQLMTTPVDTVSPDDPIGVAARVVLERHRKLLPVVRDGRLVGIVSRKDLLKPYHRSDADIAADLQATLNDPLYAPEGLDVKAEVKNGVVSLDGATQWPSDIDVVRSIVIRVPGVVAVESHLEPRESNPDPDGAKLGDPWVETPRPGPGVVVHVWSPTE
jgi:CBS domain-containing protein